VEVAVRGKPLDPSRREFVEMDYYQSGKADAGARVFAGPDAQPWERVLEHHEPLVPPAMRWLLSHPALASRIRGKVIDLGAGTCWTTALLSQHPLVDQVWAFDMSERFLLTTGRDMFLRWKGVEQKLRIAIGDFNALPFGEGEFDSAFLIACLHHSVTPFLTLTEALRCVKRGGRVFVLEHPTATLSVRKGRAMALELSRGAATEVCYTAGELEYLLQRACLPLNGKSATFRRYPVDTHTRGWRWLVRRGLRHTGLEAVLRPTVFIYEIEVQ